jgi:hypothetical protein
MSLPLPPLLLFCLFGLQGLPCGLLDSYLHTILTRSGYPPEVIGLTYWIYMPYNFRWIYAAWMDRQGPDSSRKWLPRMMAAAAGLLAMTAMFPVGTAAEEAEATVRNLPAVYLLLTLVMLLMALADPAMDAFLLKPSGEDEEGQTKEQEMKTLKEDVTTIKTSSPTQEDSSSNSVQAIAFKCGKWACTLIVSFLLVHLRLGWTSTLLAISVVYFGITWWLQRQLSKGAKNGVSDAESRSSSEEKSSSALPWRTVARHCLHAFSTPAGFCLLLLSLTNKFGECLARQLLVSFQSQQLQLAASRVSEWSTEEKEIRSTQATADIVSEAQAISLIGSFLPVAIGFLLSRTRSPPSVQRLVSSGRLWIHLTIAAILLRGLALIGMAAAVSEGDASSSGVAAAYFSSSPVDGYLAITPLWHLTAVGLFSFCSGLSTSLSYIVSLSCVRSMASSGDARIQAVHLTVYSLLESADDWTRTAAGGLAGFALTALQANYERFFLMATGLGVVPLVAAIGLAYVRRERTGTGSKPIHERAHAE